MEKTTKDKIRIEKVIKRKGNKLYVKAELDWYHYATKTELRNATGVDRYKLTAKSDLASLKVELDKIDVDKLQTVPADLSKLSNVVHNEVKLLKRLYMKN